MKKIHVLSHAHYLSDAQLPHVADTDSGKWLSAALVAWKA